MKKKLPRVENNLKKLTNIKNRAPDIFDNQIGDLIDLYKNRKIKNVVTVKNTIINLLSRNTSKAFQNKYSFWKVIEQYSTPEDIKEMGCKSRCTS